MNLKRNVLSIFWLLLFALVFALVGCQTEPEADEAAEVDVQATVDAAVSLTVTAQAENEVEAEAVVEATLLPTLTPVPTQVPATPTVDATATPPPTSTPKPTSLPIPTNTLVPTDTLEPTAVPPTAAPVNTQPPPPPTVPPEPVLGGNLLVNGSFEDGWYNLNGAPEFQLPNGWIMEFDSGPTGFGGEAWDIWFPPETRVLPYYQLPEHERSLFIRHGEYTIKAFKGNGPISLRLLQDIALEPGTYVFTVYVFPDLVSSYEGGKQFSNDPFAGEVRFISPSGGTGWLTFGAGYGTWGVFEHTFTIDTAQTVRIGVGLRGRYALDSNGFFIDDWSLQRVEN
ncbi:hypothetical protein [Candidatus Leptofilum sp.]|uniref:hypothetical protein n=1 Tax=Candidatus Leptofilum sp. TaxID=3241576 RepID=UPI003B5B8006